MLGQGYVSPIDTARAKLQEQIGNFLQGRARLARLMDNKSLTVQGQARGLYAVQTELENRLQNEITPKIQSVSSGVWTASDLITLGAFTGTIAKQINDVGKLEKAAGVTGMPSSGLDFNMETLVIGGSVMLLLGMMGGVFFGRRS